MIALTSALPLLLVGLCLGAAALAFLLWVLMTNTASDADGAATDPGPDTGPEDVPGGRTASTAGTDG